MIARFNARIYEGTLHNRKTKVSRPSRWIAARDIPLQYLQEDHPSPQDPHHPHNIEGLVWDIEQHGWRNAKNASEHAYRVESVTYDSEDDRTFYK